MMREWMALCETRAEQTPLWVNVRSKQIIDFGRDPSDDTDDEAHHNSYLVAHYQDFGLTRQDIDPYLEMPFEDMINSTEIREKAVLKGWTRVLTSKENGKWFLSIEARNLRYLHSAVMMMIQREGNYSRDSVMFFYDLLQPSRSGHLTPTRFEEFVVTGEI